MNDATPNDSQRPELGADHSGGGPDQVESVVGDNVITVIINEPGDNTSQPAPDYLRRILREYRERHPPATG